MLRTTRVLAGLLFMIASTPAAAFGPKPVSPPSVAPMASPSPSPSAAASTDPTQVPGVFDTYVLAMSYQADFCVANPKSLSCAPGAVAGMTLHGLWPDRKDDYKDTYQFCGYNEAEINKERWCSADIDIKDQMTAGELAALGAVMPGVETCLYNHEWYAHGTCSGLSVANYFEADLTLAGRFRQLPTIQKVVSESAGKTIDRATLLQAAAADLGPKSADSILIMCRKNQGKSYFTAIEVALDHKLFMDFPAEDSLAQFKPFVGPSGVPQKDNGTCPDTGILVVQ